MDIEQFLYFILVFSAALSTARGVFSKGVAGVPFGSRGFFMCQGIFFLTGGIVLSPFMLDAASISPITLVYSIVYGFFLVSAQWCYTVALSTGNIGTCTTIYSLGFIIPTVLGTVIWSEKMNFINIVGVILVIPAVIMSQSGKYGLGCMKNKRQSLKTVLLLFAPLGAMLSSGSLGFMQKLQQKSVYSNERNEFIIAAFCIAGIISVVSMLLAKKRAEVPKKGAILMGVAGSAFSLCNVINTFLAGKMSSVVFYPVLNVLTILMTMLCGIIFFKERPATKDFGVLILGVSAIILITVF